MHRARLRTMYSQGSRAKEEARPDYQRSAAAGSFPLSPEELGPPSVLVCASYPYPLVLRLRVVQIVSGILSTILGMVAYLEERGELNLCLSFPEGVAVVVAAGFSIHFARGFDGYKPVDGFRAHASQNRVSAGHQLPRRSVCTTTSSLFVAASESQCPQRGRRQSMTAATVSCSDWPAEQRQAAPKRQLVWKPREHILRRLARLICSRYGFVTALWTIAGSLSLTMLYRIGCTLAQSYDDKVAVVAVMQLAMSASTALSVLVIAYFDVAFERGAFYYCR